MDKTLNGKEQGRDIIQRKGQAKSPGNWRLKDKMEQYKQEFIEFSVMVSFSLSRMPIFLVFQGFDRF